MQPKKENEADEMLLISVTRTSLIGKLMAIFGFGKKYFIIPLKDTKITELNIQYPSTVFLESSKNVWINSKEAEKFLQSLNNEFLLHDNLGRLSSYTATLSRFLPSATIAVDRLGEESRLEREKHEAKTKRFND
jgi:hypothetical protein